MSLETLSQPFQCSLAFGARIPMRILMLSGYAGSGKDTLGAGLVRQRGYTRVCIASGLKKIAAERMCFPLEWCESLEGKRKPILVDSGRKSTTVRDLLIKIGTHERAFDANVWINQTVSEIKASGKNRIVVTDFR